eukprot:m.471190 g.471190  ORF g.471190 m.471190 type:complete len:517 (-) comp57100_c0_seq55:1468-3018(-)
MDLSGVNITDLRSLITAQLAVNGKSTLQDIADSLAAPARLLRLPEATPQTRVSAALIVSLTMRLDDCMDFLTQIEQISETTAIWLAVFSPQPQLLQPEGSQELPSVLKQVFEAVENVFVSDFWPFAQPGGPAIDWLWCAQVVAAFNYASQKLRLLLPTQHEASMRQAFLGNRDLGPQLQSHCNPAQFCQIFWQQGRRAGAQATEFPENCWAIAREVCRLRRKLFARVFIQGIQQTSQVLHIEPSQWTCKNLKRMGFLMYWISEDANSIECMQAVRQATAPQGGCPWDVSVCLGLALMRQGKDTEALALLHEALSRFSAQTEYHGVKLDLERILKMHVTLLSAIGTLLRKLGRYQDAVKVHQRALDTAASRRRTQQAQFDVAMCHNNLGVSLLHCFRFHIPLAQPLASQPFGASLVPDVCLDHVLFAAHVFGSLSVHSSQLHSAACFVNAAIMVRNTPLGKQEASFYLASAASILKRTVPPGHPFLTDVEQALDSTVLCSSAQSKAKVGDEGGKPEE